MRIAASLRLVDSRRAEGCQKLECPVSGTLHRHHTRHEAMWLGIWASRRRHESKWHAFVERYHKFLPEDCVILCPNHHAEIHQIYDRIIKEDKAFLKKPLQHYSWNQAEALMDKFHKACMDWLKTVSPGIDSNAYSRKRNNAKKLHRRRRTRR